MKTETPTPDVKALKRNLHTLFVSAYMIKDRLKEQNARIKSLLNELRDAGVGEDELVEIKLHAFYIAHPGERTDETG